MPEELLAAILQADQSEPSVRATALLRIARVLTTTDQAGAERVLDRGLALLAALPAEERTALTPQATCLAACVAPDRAFALRAGTSDHHSAEKFLFDMARHGHAPAALDYLTRWSEEGEFPYGAAREVMHYAKDDDTRRALVRSALRASHRRADRGWHSVHGLLQLLRFQWRLLADDEACDEIRQIVGAVRTRPDGRMSGSFGGGRGTVTFSSHRSWLLFELLGPLKRLDPGLADTVLREDPELAWAAERYPYGHDTEIDRPVERPSAEALEQWKREWTGFALGGRFFRVDEEKQSGFMDSFNHALRTFARDTDPTHRNAAPRECWPSAEDFRTILHAAGRYEGGSGARLLDRIPDPALRLFAQIELAAGLAGLEHIAASRSNSARGDRSWRHYARPGLPAQLE